MSENTPLGYQNSLPHWPQALFPVPQSLLAKISPPESRPFLHPSKSKASPRGCHLMGVKGQIMSICAEVSTPTYRRSSTVQEKDRVEWRVGRKGRRPWAQGFLSS